MFVFKVSHLLAKPAGEKENFVLNEPVPKELLPDVKPGAKLKGQLTLMRIPEGVVALAQDWNLKINPECGRCLENYSVIVNVPAAEREFYLKKPAAPIDLDDLYLINYKELTLDITEMVRQEILLHFPLVPLCSKRCKGLCPQCGTNLNAKNCSCQAPKSSAKKTYQPFRNLKTLL